MTSNNTLILIAALGALASCASTQPVNSNASYSDPQEATPSTPLEGKPSPKWFSRDKSRVSLEVFHEDIELDELEFDPETGSDFDVHDIDRERSGLRAAFGPAIARGYVQVFGENYGDGALAYDTVGAGGGLTGVPTVHKFKESCRMIVPYRIGLNAVWGEENAGISQDIFYAEFEGEVGVGVFYHGFQPSVGLYATTVTGAIEVNDGNSATDFNFAGSNSGGFAQVFYKHEDFPMWAKLRMLSGDVEGFLIAVGASF